MIKREYFAARDAMSVFFIGVTLFLTIGSVPAFWFGEKVYQGVFPWILSFLASVCLAASVAVYCNYTKINFVKAARLNVRPDGRRVLAALITVAGLILFMMPVVDFFIDLLIKIGYKPSGTSPEGTAETIIFVIAACFVAPVTEEIFMRGAVTGGFSGMGKLGASLVSGFLFSIFHMSPESTVHQFVLGVVLGYMFLTSGSLWIPVLAHFFNNAISVSMALFLPEVWYKIIFHNYVWVTMIAGAALAAAGLVFFAKARPDNFKSFSERLESKVFDEFGIGSLAEAGPPRVDAAHAVLFLLGILFCCGVWVLNFVAGFM